MSDIKEIMGIISENEELQCEVLKNCVNSNNPKLIATIMSIISENDELQYEVLKNCVNSNNPKLVAPIMGIISKNEELQYQVLKNCVNSSNQKLVASVISEYLENVCITNSKIAEIAKRTPQAVISMIKSNVADFPASFNILGTSYYIKEDVISWLINNNKIPRDKNDEVKEEFLFGIEKSIYFTGGPGNGKSTICSCASDCSIVKPLKKIMTAGGAADTENLIKLHFKKNSVNYVVFHYGEDGNDSIPIKITDDNVERIKNELKKCKDKAKFLREKNDLKTLLGTYVEFVLEPNKVLLKLMNECNIDILTFIDTPGLDNDHSGDSVSMADIIVMVLGDRDDIETITDKIKTNIVPKTGSTQYIYLYNNRFALNVNTLEECEMIYQESLKDAKEDLVDYSKGLKKLQDELVIGSTLSACKPIESLICVPNFSREPSIIDEFFFNKFSKKIKEAFTNSNYFTEINNFDFKNATLSKYFFEYLNKHLSKFDKKLKDKSGYSKEVFCKEKHGRTKSLDDYRIEWYFGQAVGDLKKYFYDAFSEYKTENYNEDEASAIRMAYLTINEGLMNRVHYGYGSHPWEDINSPTQMICEEVLSEEIIPDGQSQSYCQILSENDIISKSWNYVYVRNTDWNKAKLVVSNHYKFPSREGGNLTEYIEICHFIPSILIQSVLAYYKLNPSYWNQDDINDYFKVMDKIIQ